MNPIRVFVVEDEALIALELMDHLRSSGFEVVGHAARGAQARELIPHARPEVVLMDVNLPGGMSGIDVARELPPGVAVVYLTAYPRPPVGDVPFVTKPFRGPEVLAAVRSAARRDGS